MSLFFVNQGLIPFAKFNLINCCQCFPELIIIQNQKITVVSADSQHILLHALCMFVFKGAARIFQRGGHTVSKQGLFNYGQDIIMAFLPPVVGCLVKKGLQKGGHGHPMTPPGYTLGVCVCMCLCVYCYLKNRSMRSVSQNLCLLPLLFFFFRRSIN